MTTPGQFRSHARYLREIAADKRRLAASPDATPFWRKHWLRDADRMDDDAGWYENRAGWGEITVEHSTIEPMREAAE